MRALEWALESQKTRTGKVVSVILSVALVLSFSNLFYGSTAFAEESEQNIVEQNNDVQGDDAQKQKRPETPDPTDPTDPTPTIPTTPTTPTTPDSAPTPATPAAPAAPAAPADTATTTIADDANPLAAPSLDIADDATPLAAFDSPHCWVHNLMLLGLLLTIVYGAVVILRRLGYAREIDKIDRDMTGIEGTAEHKKPVRRTVHSTN